MRSGLMMALMFSVFTSAMAQVQTPVTDSTIAAEPFQQRVHCIKPVSYIIPAAMITYGFVALKSKPLIQLNHTIKESVWDQHPHQTTKIDDYTWMVPAVSVYVLNIAGIKGRHHFVDRTLLLGISYFIAGAVVAPTKKYTRELRPDGSNYFSFPSGHTTQAFAAAEFLRMEYKDVSPWYGVAGYAIAVTTGYLRMYNNKHWLSDVVAGAGVGILSVQAAYWIYPKLKQKFIKPKKGTTVLMPYYNDRQAGLSCIYQIN